MAALVVKSATDIKIYIFGVNNGLDFVQKVLSGPEGSSLSLNS